MHRDMERLVLFSCFPGSRRGQPGYAGCSHATFDLTFAAWPGDIYLEVGINFGS